jgi:lipopolysaccharide biosynthesis regulator YciM
VRDRVLRDFPGRGLQVLRRRRNAAIGKRDWREAGRLQERVEAMLAENDAAVDLDREVGVATGLAYQVGIDHLEAERLEEAAEAFNQLLSTQPGFLPARIMLGEVELLAGRDDAAVEVWRQGFVETGSAVFLQRIEDHFIESGQPENGIQTLHLLLKESGNELLPRLFLGRLYARLEMHDEALKVLESLEDRIERAPGFRYLLARIHERRGEMKKAVDALLTCVAEAGIVSAEYSCRVCRTSYTEWCDRCSSCGSWNSVDLELEEESLAGGPGQRRTSPTVVYHGEFGRKREEA